MTASAAKLSILVVAPGIKNRPAWDFTLREVERRIGARLVWREGAEPRDTLRASGNYFAILLYSDEAEGKRWFQALEGAVGEATNDPDQQIPPVCWMARSAQGARWFENEITPAEAAADLAREEPGAAFLARRTWKSHISFSLSYTVPFYFTTSEKAVFERLSATWLLCRADILATAWYMLARLEELAATERDEHGRVPASALRHVQAGDAERPFLDEACLAFLHELILICRKRGALPFDAQESGGEFRVCLTHDLDSWKKFNSLKSFAGAFKRHGKDQKGRVLSQEIKAFGGHDPHTDAALKILKEIEQGLHPTLYAVAQRKSAERHKWDPPYDIQSPKLAQFLKSFSAQKSQAELGIHPSYNAAESGATHQAECTFFKNQAMGVLQTHRFHYLRWLEENAYQLLKNICAERSEKERGGPLVDSSLGWADTPGFRNGTAHPFELIDPQTGEPIGWLEVPLIVMDTTLSNHMGLSLEQALHTTEQMMEAAERVGGVFTVLQHPHLASDVPQEDWALWWPETIDMCKAANAHFLTVSQAAESAKTSKSMPKTDEAI